MSPSRPGAALCSAKSTYEMSAGDLALEAQIKTKGDAIRDLKAGGASKDDLKPHIEVCFECCKTFAVAMQVVYSASGLSTLLLLPS